MRTSEERVKELHRRVNEMKNTQNVRRYRIVCSVAFAACLALIVGVAIFVSKTNIQPSDVNLSSAAASIFTDSSMLGGVVVSLLAFILGVLFTVFCYRLKRHMKESARDDRAV